MAFQYFIILFPIAFSVQTNSELLLQDKECARGDFFDEEATGKVKMNIFITKIVHLDNFKESTLHFRPAVPI